MSMTPRQEERVHEKRSTHVPDSDQSKSVRWLRTGNGLGFTLAAQMVSMKIAMISQRGDVPISRERPQRTGCISNDSQTNGMILCLPRPILKWLSPLFVFAFDNTILELRYCFDVAETYGSGKIVRTVKAPISSNVNLKGLLDSISCKWCRKKPSV